ncbi:unnamed protein product, partial [Staurois parvus]
RKNSKNEGRAQDKALGTKLNLVNVTFCHFQISSRSVPVRPDVAGDGTQMTDAGIRRRTLPGTLQGGHRGSEGQSKRRTERRAAPHGKPECSSGLPLVVLK